MNALQEKKSRIDRFVTYSKTMVNCQSKTVIKALKKRNLVGFTLAELHG